MDKVKLLLWKNFLIMWRTKGATLLEIFVPLVPIMVFVYLRVALKIKEIPTSTVYPPFSAANEVPLVVRNICNVIYYAPSNNLTDKIMLDIKRNYFDARGMDYTFEGYSRHESLLKGYEDTFADASSIGQVGGNGTRVFLAAIVFENLRSQSRIPSKIKYTIRFPSCQRTKFEVFRDRNNLRPGWFTDFNYPVIVFKGPRARNFPNGGFPGYFEEGFLYLQNAVDQTIADVILSPAQKKEYNEYEVKLQRFPFPPYKDDKFTFLILGFLPFYLAFAFVYSIMNLVKMMVHEKSSRLKEFMKIMGLDDWVFWITWFVRGISPMTISAGMIVGMLKIHVKDGESCFPNSNAGLMFALLMAYLFSIVCFSFFCSTLFDDEQTAATFAGFMWIVMEFAHIVLYVVYTKTKTSIKYMLCFLASPIPMSLSFYIMGSREMAEEGSKWKNFWGGANMSDQFSIGNGICMLLFNGVLYFVGACYTQLAFPGTYGVPLPWYFPFTKWFWTGNARETVTVKLPNQKPNKVRPDVFEKELSNQKAGIDIRGIGKQYGGRTVVNNLNLKMYENQVTGLLGHNGAGKSTTMAMLTGLTKPTSGTALVNNFDIRKNMMAVRASLGLCPQYNILFEDLTVEEHLKFYCKLKGLGKAETKDEIDRSLRVLGLEDKRHVASKNLSGGMKRKLCVGMAFSSGAQVVLLDEPTAGMDPAARRSTWDMIQAEKKGRTVLLSTHYMEEADLLGDRIAIMANGMLQCCGSSVFLKSKYGGDYTLIIVKKSACNVANLKKVVHSIIPEAVFKAEVGAEVSCSLPGDQIQKFSSLFDKLDSRRKQLEFESYGVASTSMEEVFFRVGADAEDRLARAAEGHTKKVVTHGVGASQFSLDQPGSQSHSVTELFKNVDGGNTGQALVMQQIKAMFVKKMIYTMRNKLLVFLQAALPLIVMGYVLWTITFYPGAKKAPKELIMSLKKSEKHTTTETLINCQYNTTACQGYKAFLCSKGYRYEEVNEDSLVPLILDRTVDDYVLTTGKHVLGFEELPPNENSSKTTIIGMFNNQHLHNAPLALNYVTNGLLRAVGSENEIITGNFPFDYEDSADAGNGATTIGKAFSASYALGVGLAFLTATFVLFPVQERQMKFKQLQIIAGVKLPIYWFINFIVDFVLYMTVTCLMYCVMMSQAKQYKHFHIFSKFFLLASLYGWSMLMIILLISRIFNNAQAAYAKLVAVNAGFGFLGLILVMFCRAKDFDMQDEADVFHSVMMFHPNYAVASGTLYLATNFELHKYCPVGDVLAFLCMVNEGEEGHPCCVKYQSNYFKWKAYGMGRHAVHMAGVGFVAMSLLILLESGVIRKIKAHYAQKNAVSTAVVAIQGSGGMEMLDNDVMQEMRRINQSNLSTLFNTENLVVRDLVKTYGGVFRAVKSISFGVPKRETFGLLGSNGAGKTTTFKMLTGDISITSGDAFINTFSVRTNLKKAHAHLGYCPQFDACLDQLTSRETLTLFARLRGIYESDITAVIEKVAEDLLFTKFLDKPFGSYSGGNKRKLSTALAMLGNPATVFLDEPTAGMDPVACRHVWDAINHVRDRGSSVILTSHNMEECEALCSKLGIMVKGQFRCIGSPQHLKNKLSQGYTLGVQLSYSGSMDPSFDDEASDIATDMYGDEGETNWATRLDEFSEFLRETFPGCTLKDEHPGFAEYHIPNANTSWSKVFGTLEEAKTVFHLDAYTVGQTSLEQVFFHYTYDQE